MKKVILSPSGQTGNKYTGNDTSEALQLRAVADFAKPVLTRHSVEVTIASPNMDVMARTAQANSMHVDVYAALHSNAGGGKGTEAYYHPNNFNSRNLTHCIYSKVAVLTPTKDRSEKNGMALFNGFGLAEIREIHPPTAQTLIECEFHDNKDGADWIIQNKEKLGEAIAQGILEYLGIAYVPVVIATPFPGAQYFGNGKKNDYILMFDKQLIKIGYAKYYFLGKFGASKSWGKGTQKACMAFQKAQGWTGSGADGLPGILTWQKLFK